MIILGLGSNLSSSYGDRFANIDLAISYLIDNEIKLIIKSSYYESLSYPNKNYPKFINVIIGIKTNLSLYTLIESIISIEKKLGRKRKEKNEPRTIDIDIIDYNRQIVDFKHKNLDFKFPHRELSNRNFVLFPLEEILPNWTDPISKELVSNLINKLSVNEKNSILKINKY